MDVNQSKQMMKDAYNEKMLGRATSPEVPHRARLLFAFTFRNTKSKSNMLAGGRFEKNRTKSLTLPPHEQSLWARLVATDY